MILNCAKKYMDVPARLDNMYYIRYPIMHITTLRGKTTTGSLFLYHDIYTTKCRAGFFPMIPIMTSICEKFWRGSAYILYGYVQGLNSP